MPPVNLASKALLIVAIALALSALYPVPISADLAPMEYRAMSLVPAENTSIRMKSELVKMTLLDRFDETTYKYVVGIRAEFTMENLADTAITMNVGFPLDDYHELIKYRAENNLYDFKVWIDRRPVSDIQQANITKAILTKRSTDYLWFNWDMTFKPGMTSVDVEYKTVTNYGYGDIYQNVKYILSSGRFWAGKIDTAVVSFRVPGGIAPEQIMPGTLPPYYELSKNTLTWRCYDLEPKGYDDIRVQFTPPALFADICHHRKVLETDPDNISSLVELARLYLSTGRAKGLGRGAPSAIMIEKFEQDILPAVRAEGDREYLKTNYTKTDQGYYQSNTPSPGGYISKRASRLFNEIGYKPDVPHHFYVMSLLANPKCRNELIEDPDERDFVAQYYDEIEQRPQTREMRTPENFTRFLRIAKRIGELPGSKYPDYFTQAETFLEKAVRIDPNNARAWNIYLTNLYKLQWSVYGPLWTSMCEIQPGQKQLIETAHAHCPSDSGIMLWWELIRSGKDKTDRDFRIHHARKISAYNANHGISR
jgi:hypothetical protein